MGKKVTRNTSRVQLNDSFKIKSIQVKKFNFEQTAELGNEEKIDLEQSIGAIAKEIKNGYIVQANIDIYFRQNKNEIFTIESIIIGIIEVQDNFNTDFLNNMVAMLYSYLRPLAAQMTTMAKLPPLDLPPLNFEKFKVKIEKED